MGEVIHCGGAVHDPKTHNLCHIGYLEEVVEPRRHWLPRGLTKITSKTHLLSYKESGHQDFQITVENANAFLDELKANGPNAKLMAKIGKDFQPEHMQEALKAQGVNHEEILKKTSGGGTGTWVYGGGGAAASAGAA